MSYNYLTNALGRLAKQRSEYDTFVGTKFARHMQQTIDGFKTVTQRYTDGVTAAYSEHLKSTGQPVSTEIKDRKKYANSLKEGPMQVDLSKSQAANESLYNQITLDNEEAYRLTKIIKNPFANKQNKVDATNQLENIKNRFNVYKQDKDLINNLYKKAFDAQQNPDPNPSLLEIRVHTELLDGSFKDNVVYNPVVGDEQKIGGYYKYEGELIALKDLKTVNKVDLEFEESLAKSITNAAELSSKGKWNESSRRELLSGMIKLIKSNPAAVRPIIFNGFTADEIDGEETSYASTVLDAHLKEYEQENNMSLNVYGRDMAIDELKNEDLTPGFTDYLVNMIDQAAAGSAPAVKPNKSRGGRQAAPLSVMQRTAQQTFLNNAFDKNQPQFEMPNTSDKVIRVSGDRFRLANSKGVPYDSMPTFTLQQLINQAEIAIPYEMPSAQKTTPSTSNDENLELTPEQIDDLIRTNYR